MAFTEGSNDGRISHGTENIIIAAPSSNVRRIAKTISICNPSVCSGITVNLMLKNTSGNGAYRTFYTNTIEVRDTLIFGANSEMFVLDSTDKSIVATLSGITVFTAPATVRPDFISSYGDVS